jgi:hypothetical protein
MKPVGYADPGKLIGFELAMNASFASWIVEADPGSNPGISTHDESRTQLSCWARLSSYLPRLGVDVEYRRRGRGV